MFTKLFKKDELPEKAAPATVAAAAPPPDKGPWEEQLRAAAGNDEALLNVAKTAPFVDIKHAAVQGLTSEESLKLAEREFRNHDRRVHREAKQRWEAKVAEREARAEAAKLIDMASSLSQEANIPANRLVELDRAWRELSPALLEESQVAAYAGIWNKLSSLTRERGDQQQWIKRWTAEANRALTQFDSVCLPVMRGEKEKSELTAACDAVEASLAASVAAGDMATGSPMIANLQEMLRVALHTAADAGVRLVFLEGLPATSDGTQGAAWQALPISDARVAAALNARFEQWQREQTDAKQARSAEQKKQSKEKTQAVRQAKLEGLEAIVVQTETALAEGHLAETIELLKKVDETAQASRPDQKLQARIETLQGEVARLKGWQHWGGGRVREDIVVEAETLAKTSSAEKLAVKTHADAIENLRERWKELDKLGGATNKTLWLRFDGALKTAYLPVAAHLAKLKAVRQENLEARNKLIAGLNEVPLAASGASDTSDTSDKNEAAVTNAKNETTEASEAGEPKVVSEPVKGGEGEKKSAPDWRAIARALEQFQTEWRKLGPIEHTVPHKARVGLEARLKAATDRLDGPLTETRRVEQAKRSKLIDRAKVLAAEPNARDVIAKVRDLQNEWQQHAKSLPLHRHEENRLWSEFKTATDAVFKQRDAAHAARDSEFKSHQVAREALIARLTALTADTPTAELKRTINDVDREWRNSGEAPRAVVAKLDGRFREARDKAQQFLAGSAKRVWHATCDALNAKLAVCEDLEAGANAGDLEARWQGIAALPSTWEQALQARFKAATGGPVTPNAKSAEAFSSALLQLEAALNVESPPAFQAARRDLKLRAMKNAMEARQTSGVSTSDIDRWLGEIFSSPAADATSRQRTSAIIAALREGTHRSA
ncbi:MAG: DUF349 domain-containing protein [Betaproteobacteria bacterium]